ncbi:hypothetical protein Tco_0262831, partial [Tanacetum coccineum]
MIYATEFEIQEMVNILFEDGSWVEAMQEELLQFKLQQVWVLVDVEKIHTDLNVVDLLTKPFDGPRFNYLVVSI